MYSVEGRCPLADSFVICKRLVCIKVLQVIVIFPESPQTFTWGGSQNELFISRIPAPGKLSKVKSRPPGNSFELISGVSPRDVPSWN